MKLPRLPPFPLNNRSCFLKPESPARICPHVAITAFFCYTERMAFLSREPRRKIEILAEDSVTLKPVFGVQPAVYVSVFFAFFLAAALFFLLVFSGLVRPGGVVSFRSEPSGAAVYVDGVYAGQTPCDAFVARGDHTMTMTMAAFHTGTVARTVENRVFGSLFFPWRDTVRLALEEDAPNAALLAGAKEFAAWSFTREPSETYQIPLVLSEGAYRSGNRAANTPAARRTQDILAGAARFTQSRAGIKDLARALFLSGNGGNAPSPLSLVSSMRAALFFLQDNPASAAWLTAVLPAGLRETVPDNGWNGTAEPGLENEKPSSVKSAVTVENVLFIQARDDLWAAATAVTEAQFARFTKANPKWRVENAEALVADGLATVDYLTGVEDTRYPAPTVSGVSWYAAEAYCDWLTGCLPRELAGWRVVLPSENQWEAAAQTAGVTGAGTIWEWCADPFAPFPALQTDAGVIAEIGSPEKLARGASWAQPRTNRARNAARGSVPPESSTPFVSFRPVLEKGL
jgi:hypothetical protein